MITEIDVRGVLARVGPDRQDLVTRPTGRAVRSSIETELALLTARTVVVLDFTSVRIIDYSCLDEIVAKLLRASLAVGSPFDTFFMIRGLNEDQVDDIEQVLVRQELVLVAECCGTLRLIGLVADDARAAFALLAARGRAAAEDLAAEMALPIESVRATLEDLCGRRVLLHDSGLYRTPTAA